MTDQFELPSLVETEAAALGWAEDLVCQVEDARVECDVMVPGQGGVSVRDQRRAERVYLMRHGSALGVIGALYRCGKISAVAYNRLTQRVRDTLYETMVGEKR